MTLQKTAPSLGLPYNTFITNSPSQFKAKFSTLPYQKSEVDPNSRHPIEGLIHREHRDLIRTSSDKTYLTRDSANVMANSNSSTLNNTYYSKDRKPSFRKRYESLNSLNLIRNQHLRIVRNFSAKELSNFDSKKNNILSGTQFLERGSISSLGQSSISHHAICSDEILLDFPTSSDRSSNSSTNKKPEKNKEIIPKRAHRSIQHALSMPGLSDDLAKDNKLNIVDAKINESKSRPFFNFFRRKLVSADRSPSPRSRSNPQPSNRSSSNPCIAPQSAPRLERTPSPLNINRRSSDQSMTSSRPQQTSSFSPTLPSTPTSYKSFTTPTASTSTSPTSTEKPTHPTSRYHRRREARSDTLTPKLIALPEYRLTLDDLPVHPSISKKLIEKTNSCPGTTILRQKSNRILVKTGEKFSTYNGSRRRSMPETAVEVKNPPEGCETDKSIKLTPKNSKCNLERNSSAESSSEKASSGEVFQGEVKSTSVSQKKRISARSDSVPSFENGMYLPGTDIQVISDAEDFEYSPTDMLGPINLSFCGSGFLGMYHLGVVSCLAHRAPSFVERIEKVGGASAGAIMAAVLLTCSDKIEESAEHIQNLAKEIRKKPLGPLTPGYNFARSLRCMLDDILPQDAHETARGTLFVSVTNADTKKNEMLSDFTSRDELIEALVASCYVPVFAGIKIPTIRGKKYTDGGISNNMPRFETGRTITISPFDGKSDIRPKVGQETEKRAHFINVQNHDVQVSMSNIKKGVNAFFPPKRQALQELFEKGRYDANRFLVREGLYEIVASPLKKAVLYESSV